MARHLGLNHVMEIFASLCFVASSRPLIPETKRQSWSSWQRKIHGDRESLDASPHRGTQWIDEKCEWRAKRTTVRDGSFLERWRSKLSA